jgi:rhodanese-related sulfurtransferase
MKELSKTNRLTIVVSAFVLVILIGLITLRRPEVTYSLTPEECLTLLTDPAVTVSPEKADSLLRDPSGKTIAVDVRTSVAYDRGHMDGAANIPLRELFSRVSRSFFRNAAKSGKAVLLYGSTRQQANSAWMMLMQTGSKGLLVYGSNFPAERVPGNDSLPAVADIHAEVPAIDTVALKALTAAKPGEGAVKTAVSEKKPAAPVHKAGSSGGGC